MSFSSLQLQTACHQWDFDHDIFIDFYDQEVEEGGKRYPYASTCGLQLFLPRGVEDLSSFEEMMKESIFGSYGFDKS